MNKNILITGTDGFIGSYLKSYFIEKGYDVFGTVFNLRDPHDNEVKVDVVLTEGQQRLMENLKRKGSQAEVMFSNLVKHMSDAENVKIIREFNERMELPKWL